MFIIAKQSVQFTHPVTGDHFAVANGFSGDVPDWIADTDLYKQIARAGTESVIQVVSGKGATPVDGVPFRDEAGNWVLVQDGVRVRMTVTGPEGDAGEPPVNPEPFAEPVAPKTPRKSKVESSNDSP